MPIEQAFLSRDLHDYRPYPGSMGGWEIDVMAWDLHAGRPVCDAGHCVGWTSTCIELAGEPSGLYLNWSCRGRGPGLPFALLTRCAPGAAAA